MLTFRLFFGGGVVCFLFLPRLLDLPLSYVIIFSDCLGVNCLLSQSKDLLVQTTVQLPK